MFFSISILTQQKGGWAVFRVHLLLFFTFACAKCRSKQMNIDNFMNNLAELISNEIGKKNLTYSAFADLCGLHRNEISNIISRRKKDILISTIFKICENSEISEEHLFGYNIENQVKEEIMHSTFIIGKNRYKLR